MHAAMFKSFAVHSSMVCRMCTRPLTSCPALWNAHFNVSSTVLHLHTTQKRNLSTKTSKEKSALYVNPTETDRSPTVEVSLNIQQRLSDINKLKDDISLRGFNVDVDALRSEYEILQLLKSQKDLFEKEHKEISQEFADLVKAKKNDEEAKEKKKELAEKGRKLRPSLKRATATFLEAENTFILDALKLPVELASETPLETTTIAELGSRFDAAQKNHLQLLGDSGITLSDISPGAYYLTGNVSKSERQLLKWTKEFMTDLHLTRISFPDLFKEVVVEGCGFHDEEVIRLERKLDSDDAASYSSLNLGSSALLGFAAYYTRMNIHEDDLPLQCYSSSVVYSPVELSCVENYGLYCVPQSSSVDMFSLSKTPEQSAISMAEFAFNITQFYEELQVPIRVRHVGASSLRRSESQRINFEVWSSGFNRYFKIGEVSDRSDYISRRLMIMNSANPQDFRNASPPYLIHATLTNVQTLLAAILENSQSQDGCIQLPNV